MHSNIDQIPWNLLEYSTLTAFRKNWTLGIRILSSCCWIQTDSMLNKRRRRILDLSSKKKRKQGNYSRDESIIVIVRFDREKQEILIFSQWKQSLNQWCGKLSLSIVSSIMSHSSSPAENDHCWFNMSTYLITD